MTTTNIADVRIARSVRDAEHEIDDALAGGAGLLISLIERRKAHNLAAEVGHDAIEASVEVIALLTQARAAQVRCHTALARVAQDQGIGWHLAGPLEDKIKGQAAASRQAA